MSELLTVRPGPPYKCHVAQVTSFYFILKRCNRLEIKCWQASLLVFRRRHQLLVKGLRRQRMNAFGWCESLIKVGEGTHVFLGKLPQEIDWKGRLPFQTADECSAIMFISNTHEISLL